MRNWKALLQKDQLRIEQRKGRVFEGWNEGKIYLPPTYKYFHNLDRYMQVLILIKKRNKEFLHDCWLPVYSVFLAEVESLSRGKIRKSMSCSSARIEVEELLPQRPGYTGFNFY